jgi:hypothetical protein
LATFYHISFANGRKEKRVFPLVREETEEVLKSTDAYPVGMTPNEEIGKSKFRDGGWILVKKGIEERFIFER